MEVRIDDLTGLEIAALLQEHLDAMIANSPPCSKHALDLDGLRRPEITFFTIWDGTNLAGCGALKELKPQHGEIKSMRTATAYLRKGVAQKMLGHIIKTAQARGYSRISLETGAAAYFKPAHSLYASFGFIETEAFGGYKPDPNSIFMTKGL